MKKVVIFGAAGHTGKYITEKMKAEKDIELSVFVRNPAKFEGMDLAGVNIIQGDALKKEDVKKAMEGQEVLLCSPGLFLQLDFPDETDDRQDICGGGAFGE